MRERITASVLGRWAYDRLFLKVGGESCELSLSEELVESEDVPAPGSTIWAELSPEGEIVAWDIVDRDAKD